MRRYLGRFDDREPWYGGQGARVAREVGEEGLLVGKDGRVGFFLGATELDAEEAAVEVVVDITGGKV
jgi:hypothetical protein